jgi:hypothetical protein
MRLFVLVRRSPKDVLKLRPFRLPRCLLLCWQRSAKGNALVVGSSCVSVSSSSTPTNFHVRPLQSPVPGAIRVSVKIEKIVALRGGVCCSRISHGWVANHPQTQSRSHDQQNVQPSREKSLPCMAVNMWTSSKRSRREASELYWSSL